MVFDPRQGEINLQIYIQEDRFVVDSRYTLDGDYVRRQASC